MRRPDDWLRQAKLDLEAARTVAGGGHYEWACFLAQQAGEKAVKAAHEADGTEAWGHSVAALLGPLGSVPESVLDAARGLDKHYIPTRYPNTHPQGAPGDLYTSKEADEALGQAETILEHARRRLPST